MQLIGMLDSPCAPHRHLAAPAGTALRTQAGVGVQHLRCVPRHQPGGQGAHRSATTAVLMDSTLIIDYAETVLAPGRSLMPAEPRAARARCAVSAWRWPPARRPCRSSTNAGCVPRQSATRPAGTRHPAASCGLRRTGGRTAAGCGPCRRRGIRRGDHCGGLALYPDDGGGCGGAGGLSAPQWFFVGGGGTEAFLATPAGRWGLGQAAMVLVTCCLSSGAVGLRGNSLFRLPCGEPANHRGPVLAA